MEKVISVNVCDMSKDPIVSQFLICPVIPSRQIININPSRLDEGAVILECDRERALAIVHVIRHKYGKNEFRCYDGKKRI
jgi:hypothetical protein